MIKISGIVTFSALYWLIVCYAFGVFSKDTIQFATVHDTEETSCYFSQPVNQEGAAIPLKTEKYTTFGSPESRYTPQQKLLSGIVNSTERLFANAIGHYIFQSLTFSVRFRKSDNLFPFHYFW